MMFALSTLNESTVLVEFADGEGRNVERLPVPKALLANYHGGDSRHADQRIGQAKRPFEMPDTTT